MAHNCLRYWGNQATVLGARLDQGYADPAGGGPGWATRLASKEEYDALVILQARMAAARMAPPPPLGPVLPWTGGTIGVTGLFDATNNMIGGLEGDRLSTSLGAHVAAAPQWHTTGVPDPNSIPELNKLWGRVRNALGC